MEEREVDKRRRKVIANRKGIGPIAERGEQGGGEHKKA